VRQIFFVLLSSCPVCCSKAIYNTNCQTFEATSFLNSKTQGPRSKSQVPRPKFQIPNPKFQIPSSKTHIPKGFLQGLIYGERFSKTQNQNSKSQVPRPKFQKGSHSVWNLKLGIWSLVFGAWYLTLGI
jgi:hypothetical protein